MRNLLVLSLISLLSCSSEDDLATDSDTGYISSSDSAFTESKGNYVC